MNRATELVVGFVAHGAMFALPAWALIKGAIWIGTHIRVGWSG